MKCFFNRKPINGPWGGGNVFVTNMAKYLRQEGHDVVFDFEYGIDVIFMIDPRPSDYGFSINEIYNYKKQFPNVKIIHRVNECDKRKNTNIVDNILLQSNQLADKTVFISKWLADYFTKKGFNKDYSVIYNGCDRDIFYPIEEKDLEGPLKLVTHHWSDNWMKGFDIYTQIDRYLQSNNDFEFTYVGRYNKDYIPKKTKIVAPLHGTELGEELRKHDIYVTASRWEPCGMHHVEGAASGLPTLFHKEGGGINELCIQHGHEYSNFDTFLQQLSLLKESFHATRKKINYENIDIMNCCRKYYNIVKFMVK